VLSQGANSLHNVETDGHFQAPLTIG